MTQLRRSRFILSLAVAGALLWSAAGRAQTMGDPEEFSAFAVNMGNLVSGTTATMVITVNRWSTAAERENALTILREKGPNGLLELLQKSSRVGSLRTTESIGYDLRYAIQDPLPEGGRRVLLVTDRPLGFYEARNRPHTIDYPLTVIEMSLKPDGTGQGTLSLAARMLPAGKNIVVENFDTQPIRLNRIQTRTLTKK